MEIGETKEPANEEEEDMGAEEGEEEDIEAPKPGSAPFVEDRQRCTRIIQPQNEKGQYWPRIIIKFAAIHDEQTIWSIIHKDSFYFIVAFDYKTAQIDFKKKPFKFEEMPLSMELHGDHLYWSDVRKGFRSVNITLPKIKADYMRTTPNNHYLETNAFTFAKDGKLYSVPEPSDHKNFSVCIYTSEKPDLWTLIAETLSSTQRVECLLADVDENVWTSYKDGSITIWNPQGKKVKSWDAAKKKKALNALYCDGNFVFGAGMDHRIYKWTKDGELVRRIYVKQRAYHIMSVKGMWFAGIDDGDIIFRNESGYLIGVFRAVPKTSSWDEDDAEKKEKELKKKRGHVRGLMLINNGNTLLSIQPQYRCIHEWDLTDIEKVPYSGSKEQITIHKAIEHKEEPVMKDGCILM